MKIVVVGGSGLIGSRLCSSLCGMGHEVFDASPVEGVDAVSGKGLAGMLEGAQVVVDVSDPPSLDGAAALAFFRAAGQQLMAAEIAAGVRHHLVLSIVGADRLVEGPYFRAKLQQEDMVRASGIPYTIVRSTQFIDFLGRIADNATTDGTVGLPDALVQPVDADEVAAALAACAVDGPQNRIVEIAGPVPVRLDQAVRRYLAAAADPRPVGVDAGALFFGSALMEQTLLPAAGARLGRVTLDGWVAKQRDGLMHGAEARHG